MSPIAALHMADSKRIVIKLLPGSAPNTVNSFTYTVSRGYLDHHAIERIVPGNWVDVSYTALGKKECRYLIFNEFELNPDVELLDPYPGFMCMGGYGEAELVDYEFFLPLRDCPNHRGIYPVSGRVLEGMDEVYRLEKVETVPVMDLPTEGVEVNHPVRPEIIERVELEFYGTVYSKPVRVRESEPLECWKDEAAE